MAIATRSFKKIAFAIAVVIAGLCTGLWLLTVAVQHARRQAILSECRITKPETGYPFPVLPDIARMTIENFCHPDGPSLPYFDVPQNCWAEIIDSLSPSQYDARPCTWVIAGSMVIECKQGPNRTIGLYFVGQVPTCPDVITIGAFSAGPNFESRKYYRGGNEARLKAAIIQAYAEHQKDNHAGTADKRGG